MKCVLFLTILSLAWGLDDDIPQTTLHGGQVFPLVGMGLGNLQHDLLEKQIVDGMEMQYRLIDTGHASNNEHIIAAAIKKGFSVAPGAEMHVVTKVWYTHLGYERTKISVKESLERLNVPNVKVHLMIHWPRCRDDVSWMDCKGEEAALPAAVKKAGPAPHLNKDTAFIDSWRALEDIFLGKISLGKGLPKIESIGVSNFDINDLKALEKGARVKPHILQHNAWMFLFDPDLMAYLKENKIHFQAYNVMAGIIGSRHNSPNVVSTLDSIIDHLTGDSSHSILTHAQVILKYFVQNGVSVIPRTSKHGHLSDMAPKVIGSMSDLDDHEQGMVRGVARALIAGEDFGKPARASFVNKHNSILHFFWWSEEDAKEIPVKILAPGESWDTYTGKGHVFIAYNTAKTHGRRFTVKAEDGQTQKIHVDGLDEL